MRVENPNFTTEVGLLCEECPWADENGWNWREEPCELSECPRNMEEYTAACLMAEEAAKGGKG